MADAREYVFSVSWFDELGGVARPYRLTYFDYPDGHVEISIYDVSKRKMFLKRGPYTGLLLKNMHEGALITVYARQFKVTGYASLGTQELFASERGLVTCVVPATAYRDFGNVLATAQRAGFALANLKTLSEADAPDQIYLAAELVGCISGTEGDQQLWDRVFRGATEPGIRSVQVRRSNPETAVLFRGSSTTATFDHCALLVVKPHAVREGHTGEIVNSLIDANFEISAMQTFTLSRKEAENFTEVYDGVIPKSEYANLTSELSSGPLVAIEVRAENCVEELRKLVGPHEIEVAKRLRPTSLRARFGLSDTKNAIHCTDLAEDGQLDSSYFFDILLNQPSPAH